MPGFNVAQRDGRVKTRNIHGTFPERVHDSSPEAPAASGELPFRSSELPMRDGCYGTSRSRRFGEPLPGLVTTLVVAPLVSAVATWAGVAEVWPAR
jgi:hypothetical protein